MNIILWQDNHSDHIFGFQFSLFVFGTSLCNFSAHKSILLDYFWTNWMFEVLQPRSLVGNEAVWILTSKTSYLGSNQAPYKRFHDT